MCIELGHSPIEYAIRRLVVFSLKPERGNYVIKHCFLTRVLTTYAQVSCTHNRGHTRQTYQVSSSVAFIGKPFLVQCLSLIPNVSRNNIWHGSANTLEYCQSLYAIMFRTMAPL